MLSEDSIREELKKVIDPELFVNIIDLGLVYVVTIAPAAAVETTAEASGEPPSSDEQAAPATTDGANDAGEKFDVTIEMTMTSPACPAGPQLIANSKQVVERLENVNQVEVRIVMEPPWTPDRMTDDARDQLGIF
ncbi:MAG: metal-sulfur cluster assembly factor [Planctomycetales bacterium]|nr:metal-sulfur cluster assembly factor [Planctomycetales bacterium]